MNTLKTTATATLLGLALATSAAAQQAQENFPKERTQAGTCSTVDWNKEMLLQRPGLIKACQEVVLVDGENWARFAAKFVEVRPNGNVVFSVRDQRDRAIEEVILTPLAGQVAYIEDRPTPFRQLRTTDKISLYVPEGQYGFTTRPIPQEPVATIMVPAPAVAKTTPADSSNDRTVAQRDTTPRVLPATASSLPWLAFAGFLSLLGGMTLTLRRWS